ncbi:MAG TPA: PKD domain-containing protein [Clostridia bacterium]|nr:PKD domain-containing protein [Clostridia bacterium]
MDILVIAEKYEVIDTLFSSELQTVYSAKKQGVDDSKRYIINEFKNTDTIYSMKDNFSIEKCRYIRNIVETFYENFCFYVVCNICSGPTIEAFLSNNSLRLTEKMYLTESLLTQLIDMEKLSPFIVHALCDTDNLAVTGRRNICFNCNLKFTEDNLSANKSDVSRRVGEIICAIFANTTAADPERIKDILPPALFPIVQNCLEGKYESIAKVYSDFKALLIYSVFMGSGSVENQIKKNYQKAKIKRKLTPVRRVAAIILILLLAGGIWTVMKDFDITSWNKGQAQVQNAKPAAMFSASREQVYAGETVVFTSESTDPDANDSIKSYSWVISKDNTQIFSSSSQNISYTFTETGSFKVQLVVSDSLVLASSPYEVYITVLPKPVLPDTETDSDTENNK